MNAGTEPAASAAQKVFISYRREETAPYAGRLYDAMVAKFGERNVFMDVGLAPGVDFVEQITEVVSGCVVLIIVMGPSWASVSDEGGNARLADPDDFVRLEVETALRRHDVTPIPVLVAGAHMPKVEELPKEMRPLLRRNALEMSDARWSYDVGRLNDRLDELLAKIGGGTDGVGPRQARTDWAEGESSATVSSTRMLIEGMVVAGLTAYAARWLAQLIPEGKDTAGQIAGVILRRGETWALAGAALAVWLGIRTNRANLMRIGVAGLLVGALAGAAGGAIWAGLSHLLDYKQSSPQANRIEVGAIAVTGAVLGALLGWLWQPPRVLAAALGGAAGAALAQLIVNGTGWDATSTAMTVLIFAFWTVAIVGLSLVTLIALDSQAVRATRPAAARRTG